MCLRTHLTNVGGLRLYDRCGFRRVSTTVFAAAFPLSYLAVNFDMDLTDGEGEDYYE